MKKEVKLAVGISSLWPVRKYQDISHHVLQENNDVNMLKHALEL